MKRKPVAKTSRVVYRGPSLIDGKPIVVVAVVTTPRKANTKTGAVVQTYILCDGIEPRHANRTGADFSICGNCRHRGITDAPRKRPRKRGYARKRSCYVNLMQGVRVTYEALMRGYYPDALSLDDIAAVGRGRVIREGTYGDPAAVPAWVWVALRSESAGHTAYSHQAKHEGAAFDAQTMMLSADTLQEAQEAWANGIRTFRVVTSVADIAPQEALCPASKEHKAAHPAKACVTCALCQLCAGSAIKAKSIAIPAHGGGRSHFIRAA